MGSAPTACEAFSLVGQLQEVLAQETPATKSLALTSVDTFLAIDSTGAVTVYSGKVDLGKHCSRHCLQGHQGAACPCVA